MAARDLDLAASPVGIFGAMLRRYRVKAAMSQDQLGARVFCSGDLVGKIENGQRVPTVQFAAACDSVAELGTGGVLSELREVMGGFLKQRAYPGWFVGWPDKEASAKILRSFELVIVPGLLQTQEYARAMLANRIVSSSDDTDELVAARMERQSILAREEPPELWVVIDEAVLHRRVGGARVMREQINELIKAARRSSIVLQVIPAAVGVHEGLPGAGFIIADFEAAPAAAYQDTAVRGQVIEDSDDIAVLMGTWDRLRAEALPRTASLDLMEEVCKTWT